MKIFFSFSQQEHRINNQLARAVIGNVPTALDFYDGYFPSRKHIGSRLLAPSQGVNVIMLNQDQRVLTLALLSLG